MSVFSCIVSDEPVNAVRACECACACVRVRARAWARIHTHTWGRNAVGSGHRPGSRPAISIIMQTLFACLGMCAHRHAMETRQTHRKHNHNNIYTPTVRFRAHSDTTHVTHITHHHTSSHITHTSHIHHTHITRTSHAHHTHITHTSHHQSHITPSHTGPWPKQHTSQTSHPSHPSHTIALSNTVTTEHVRAEADVDTPGHLGACWCVMV